MKIYLVVKKRKIVYVGTNERVAKDKARLFSSRLVIAAEVALDNCSLSIKPISYYIQSSTGGRFEDLSHDAFDWHPILYHRYFSY